MYLIRRHTNTINVDIYLIWRHTDTENVDIRRHTDTKIVDIFGQRFIKSNLFYMSTR